MAVTSFDPPLPKILRALRRSVCYDADLLAMKYSHCAAMRICPIARRFPSRVYCMVVDLFCSCDLDLDPMTFIYELKRHSVEIHRICKYELRTSRLIV